MRSSKETTRGLAIGTFDLFHPGHANFLGLCKAYSGHLTVALNTDAFAARYKRKPILTLDERIEMLTACKYVDEVVINRSEEDCKPTILNSRADTVFHGDDWIGESLRKQMGLTEEWLKEHGVRLQHMPYTRSISTTEILKRVECQASKR